MCQNAIVKGLELATQSIMRAWMRCSVRLSSELVASSSSSRRGFFRMARATATRCFSPAPELHAPLESARDLLTFHSIAKAHLSEHQDENKLCTNTKPLLHSMQEANTMRKPQEVTTLKQS